MGEELGLPLTLTRMKGYLVRRKFGQGLPPEGSKARVANCAKRIQGHETQAAKCYNVGNLFNEDNSIL